MTPEDDKPEPQGELDRYRAENLALKRRLSEHERRVDDLLASTSWRMTAPVRWLARWMRSLGAIGWCGSQRSPGEGAHSIARNQYRRWLRANGTIDAPTRATMEASINEFASRPLISVIMPSYNVELNWLRDAIQSVREQIYPHFELCISDDASTVSGTREFLEGQAARDKRIRLAFRETNGHISVNSNTALTLATGDYVALMDADDLLAPDALYWIAHAIALHPDVDLLFSDEDKIREDGERFDPYFKSAWNPALMLSQNAFSHLGIFRRNLVEKVGRFREGLEGAQDHDLVLRCAEATSPERIRHIPRILYHWRTLPDSTSVSGYSKPYAWDAGRRAIEQHLKRRAIGGSVEPALSGFYRVCYDAPAPPPLVSIFVLSDLRADAMHCLNAILSSTTYGNFELIIVADHPDIVAARIKAASALSDPRVRILVQDATASNRAARINAAAAEARGSLLCLLDENLEPVTGRWLDQLVARAVLDDVGLAGPMICGRSGELLHAGLIFGAGGVAGYPFQGFDSGAAGYFGRATLEQDYTCLSSACMVIRRKAFDAGGGFDTKLSSPLDEIDFCLRVRRSGLRAVWVPTAKMQQRPSTNEGGFRAAVEAHDADGVMRERWGHVMDDDPYYNPNLSLDPGRMFQLDFPARIGLSRDTSAGALLKMNSSRTAAV